jgi:predicted nucleic acid-binding protein
LTYFLDASALVKRYIREPGSDRVQALIRRRPAIVISRLTVVEVPAGVWKRCRTGDVSREDAGDLVTQFETDVERMTIVEPRAATVELAASLVSRYPLRAYDAVQLASAIRWSRETGLATCFVCADRALSASAAAEKMRRITLGEARQ